jgi:hypothetical protein
MDIFRVGGGAITDSIDGTRGSAAEEETLEGGEFETGAELGDNGAAEVKERDVNRLWGGVNMVGIDVDVGYKFEGSGAGFGVGEEGNSERLEGETGNGSVITDKGA